MISGTKQFLGIAGRDRKSYRSIEVPIRLDGVVFVFSAFVPSVMNQMEAFRILASADRQLVLHELLERDEGASIEEISQQVAARRHRISPEKISDTEVEHAHVRLVHAHLPKLHEKGIINVDWGAGEISLLNGEDVDHLFDAANELESWPPNDLLEHPSRSQ